MADALPVAVIGAGVVGMAAARALQRVGQSVIVLDPNEPGSGCSAGNAGYLATELVMPMAQPGVIAQLPRMLTDPLGPLALKPARLVPTIPWMLRFALASFPGRLRSGTAALAALLRQAWPAWQEEIAASGIHDLFVSRGSLVVYEHQRSLPGTAAEGRVMAEHGVAFEDLSAADLLALLPSLRVSIAGGRRFPNSSHVRDPRAVVEALARRFVADGGHVEAAKARGFSFSGGEVDGVVTESGTVRVAGAVLAAGAGGGALARELGANAPLTRERGYHVMVPGGDLPLNLPVASDRGFVMTPMAMGTRLAGTVELGAGDKPDWRRADILLGHARALFGNPGLEATSRWFGDRPSLPDYLPMIDRAPRARNAVLALGHQHLGLTLAAITGRLVAELVTGMTPAVDLTPFRAGRFGRRTAVLWR